MFGSKWLVVCKQKAVGSGLWGMGSFAFGTLRNEVWGEKCEVWGVNVM